MQQQSNTDLNSESHPSLVERFFGKIEDARFTEFDDELLVFCTMGGIALKIWKIYHNHAIDRKKSIRIFVKYDESDMKGRSPDDNFGLFGEVERRSPA
jgi:hypothetical protein